MTKLSAEELDRIYVQSQRPFFAYSEGVGKLAGHIAALQSEKDSLEADRAEQARRIAELEQSVAEVEHDRNRSVNHLHKLAHDLDDLRAELAACKAERDALSMAAEKNLEAYREAQAELALARQVIEAARIGPCRHTADIGTRVYDCPLCVALAAYDALKKP